MLSHAIGAYCRRGLGWSRSRHHLQRQLLGQSPQRRCLGNGASSSTSTSTSTADAPAAAQQLTGPPAPMQQTTVMSEDILHQRYLTVYNRRVQFSSPSAAEEARVIDFDIAGHPQADFAFAVTFPFHSNPDGSKGGSVTVVREYAQGLDSLVYCLPTGGKDPARHASLLQCAQAELSEEAWLTGGTWVPLLPPGHAGLAEVKWCRNRFQPFLVLDPVPDTAPGSRDAEELSLEVLRLSIPEFEQLLVSGDMMLPSVTTGFMALQRLRQMGLLQ